jgi:hypothetical protein
MFLRVRGWLVPAALCVVFTGCGGQSSVPSGTAGSLGSVDRVPAALRPPMDIAATKQQKNFGVGLQANASIVFGNGFSKSYCQSKGASCPPTKLHLKKAKFATSKSLSGKDGTFTVAESAASELGDSTYSVTASASSSDQSGAVEGSSATESFNWTDTLHVSSSTLPQGSPVTISISFQVNPGGTNVDCGNPLAAATLTFIATGQDASGNAMSVSGNCNGSSFEYLLGNGTQGTSETGTIQANVGDSVTIAGNGSVSGAVCGSFGGTCVGGFDAALSGSATWKIPGITKGATYTTDSEQVQLKSSTR